MYNEWMNEWLTLLYDHMKEQQEHLVTTEGMKKLLPEVSELIKSRVGVQAYLSR